MKFCEFLKGIDFFGKNPEFYIKGKPKLITFIGRIFTPIFLIIYIIIFCYKLYRMIQRVDFTIYESYSNADKISVKLTDENFSLLFAVYNEQYEPFIDERIYYPKAYFIDEEMEEIKIERCNINKINSKFRQYFQESNISNYYCLNNINYNFIPYMNSLIFKILPCKNNTGNNNHCKSKEIIEENLNERYFKIYFQDILLTPINYISPAKERYNFLDTNIFKNTGQYLYTEMQLVKIETSTNIIGFDFLTQSKVEDFIKFDNVEIIPYPGYNLDDETNNFPILIFEFLLNDKIMHEKRQYLQLIDILGEIGGLMEIIYSFFSIISSLFVNILY